MKALILRRLGAVVVIGALSASSLATPASASLPTPSSGALWGQGQQVQYRWASGSEPPTWMRSAINSAAGDAGATSGASTPILTYAASGPAWVSYTADIPTSYAVGYAVRNVPTSFGIRLRPQGYVLDWGTLRWCQFYDNPPNGCYDAEMITLHEFGHVLTLGHVNEADVTDWLDTVMHVAPKTKAKVGWNAHGFGRCDVARLQLLYAAASTSKLISTCLDLGTQMTLTSSPSGTVGYGSNVSFTAKLLIESSSRAGGLSSAPLSSRYVALQRRAIGSTNWTDVAQMSSQSANPGGYLKTITVSATYDYRARFATPSGEGLSGSTSAVVRISAGNPCVNSGIRSSINVSTC